jgi:hypothetical protein
MRSGALQAGGFDMLGRTLLSFLRRRGELQGGMALLVVDRHAKAVVAAAGTVDPMRTAAWFARVEVETYAAVSLGPPVRPAGQAAPPRAP